MTHNFKHILVKREDNQLVCLCYPKPQPKYDTYGKGWLLFQEVVRLWKESVVRIPCAHKINFNSFKDGESINPEMIEIREDHNGVDLAYLSSPKEEKAEKIIQLKGCEAVKCESCEQLVNVEYAKMGNEDANWFCRKCWDEMTYVEPALVPMEEYLRMKASYDELKSLLEKQPVEEEESEDQLWDALIDEWNYASLSDAHGNNVVNYLKTKFNITRK